MTEKKDSNQTWGGRFEEGMDPRVDRLNASVPFDQRLGLQDIAVNKAHGRMLNKIGLIGDDEWPALEKGLDAIAETIKTGDFDWKESLEDVHMNIEAVLTEACGPSGAKIHSARSRNDQVAADFRLFVLEAEGKVLDRLLDLRHALVDLARGNIDVILPGYTHVQRAQPVRLSLHLLAYAQMFGRDADRLADARKRADFSPLGAAALAGTTFPIDQAMTAAELGFGAVCDNAMDAVADRDFALDFLYGCAVLACHMSRLAEELVFWSSQEFGFIELADAFTTGSSIMPQKKNPDMAELIRGKTGRVYGNLVNLLTVLKGLPMTYNKDLQEDKEPVFDTFDTVMLVLDVLPDMLRTMTVKAEAMRAACLDGFLEATDLADYLANKGLPFRQAHHQVGALVKYCLDRGQRIVEVDLDELKKICPLVEADVFDYLALEKVVDRRKSIGGPAREEVLRQIDKLAGELEG